MSYTAYTVRTLQAVAMTVGIAVFLWSTGLTSLFQFAEASSITSASDTLSSSAPSLASNHTIAFTSPNGVAANQTITITFPAQFTIPGPMNETDVDIASNTVDQTVAAANGAGTWGAVFAGQVLTLTAPSDTIAASTTAFVVKIGTNAVGGDQQITNPAATTTSYEISIGGSMPDSGSVRVAIVDQVQVSASVDTVLSFVVSGVNAGLLVNGSPTSTSATTSSNSIPFGLLTPNVSKTAAHDLSVTTNAAYGYTVTVETTGALQSTTGATIEGFIDGSNTNTPVAWQKPSALVADPNTYGHWGITSDDGTTTRSAPDEFDADEWVAPSTTPIVVMGNNQPADGTTEGYGLARVGYQIQISALQEAGDDYTTTLRYIATPTF